MPQEAKAPYRDFHLLVLNHLTIEEVNRLLSPSRKTILDNNQSRLGHGKQVIRTKTRRGDTVALESPEEITFEAFYPFIQAEYKKAHGRPLTRDTALNRFERVYRHQFGFYTELAQFAESIGRKVVSLEPHHRKPVSRLMAAYFNRLLEGNSYQEKRGHYLINPGVDDFFSSRIQARKPKLVIVAKSHGIFLEDRFKPSSVEYYERVPADEKETYLAYRKKISELYKKAKMGRRAAINEARGLKGRTRG